MTILLIAHNMGFLSSVADNVVVMAEGKVLVAGRWKPSVLTTRSSLPTSAPQVTQSGEGAGNARA